MWDLNRTEPYQHSCERYIGSLFVAEINKDIYVKGGLNDPHLVVRTWMAENLKAMLFLHPISMGLVA